MSTRSTTHFIYGNARKPEAIIYRHSDGYPEGAGRDILDFLDQCATLKSGSRFSDPSYLAAKYVVFLADMFNTSYQPDARGKDKWKRNESKLDFLSVGVVSGDPGDIEYRYTVNCNEMTAGKPTVKCFAISGKWDAEKKRGVAASKWILTEVAIPPAEVVEMAPKA